MKRQLPATLKIKDQEYKTESIPENAKKIFADILFAEDEISRYSAKLRICEIARKELLAMLEKEAQVN